MNVIGTSIRKRPGKTPAGIIRGGLALIAAVTVLLITMRCSGQATEEDELEDVGPDMSFFVTLSISTEIAVEYELTRLLVYDSEKKRKIGSTALTGQNTNRYRVTLPASYIGKDVTYYVVEFVKKESSFDGGQYNEYTNVSITTQMIGLLKSRYYEIFDKIPTNDGDTISLTINNVENLKIGFGPGGLELGDIRDMPHVYLINLSTSNINDYGLTVKLGIAADSASSSLITDIDGGLGVAAPETDWIILLEADVYDPGDSLTFWFTLSRDQNVTATQCPCKDSGNCSCSSILDLLCSYNLKGPMYAKKVVSSPPPDSGSTIQITLCKADLLCH